MENCEVMTSPTHSFTYSYACSRNVSLTNYKNSKCLPYFVSNLHHIFTDLFEMFNSFVWINLNLDLSSPLNIFFQRVYSHFCSTYTMAYGNTHFNIRQFVGTSTDIHINSALPLNIYIVRLF